MAAPALKSLYKRELLVAPKPAFAIAGCPELHTLIAERIRDKIKLTGSVPSVPEFPQVLGALLHIISLSSLPSLRMVRAGKEWFTIGEFGVQRCIV